MILAELLLRVLRRLMLYLHLRCHRRDALLLHHMDLRGQRLRLYPSASAVEADPVVDPACHRRVVNDYVVGIHIANHVCVYARDGGVVEKVAAVPVAAVVTMPDVAVPVIHAAIVPDVQPPVTVVEAIGSAIESPVARSPQSALIRCIHPAAGDPVVSLRPPRPVSRSPQVVRVRSGRLIVLRQRRWRIAGLRIGQIVGVEVCRLLVAKLACIRGPVVIALLT
jgi:hypothetical protein